MSVLIWAYRNRSSYCRLGSGYIGRLTIIDKIA